jgi:hypothetical protein
MRVMSLRGAQEISNFAAELVDDDPTIARNSRALLEVLAEKMSIPAVALKRTIDEIAEDPYTEFLRSVWQQPDEEKDGVTVYRDAADRFPSFHDAEARK